MIFGISIASRSCAAFDKLAGPMSAVHTSSWKSLTPASASEGASGINTLRPLVVRPITFSLPPLACGCAMPGGTSAIWICPPIMAVTTCGLP